MRCLSDAKFAHTDVQRFVHLPTHASKEPSDKRIRGGGGSIVQSALRNAFLLCNPRPCQTLPHIVLARKPKTVAATGP